MRIILTTILMLVCLVAYSATPSYSNFSSNQFAPSGTYTVTVKNQPLLTNIVEHAQLSLTNPAFANSLVYITNMTGTNGITNGMVFVSHYGPQVQFSWMTSGIGSTNISMVISNGRVGIGKGNPAVPLDVNGGATFSGTVSAGGNASISVNGISLTATTYIKEGDRFTLFPYMNNGVSMATPGVLEIGDGFVTQFQPTNGCALLLLSGTNASWTTLDSPTNTAIYTDGNALHVSDSLIINSNIFPITANFGNMKPCGCVTWMSNFTCYMICTNSADGNATTNKLGGL